jgi:hypothetical protein
VAEALAGVLPIAVGIVVVPLPIAAVIVILFSPRATANGFAFLGGWVAGLAAVGGLTLLIADGSRVAEEAGAARWASAIKLLLGAALLFLAYRSFEKRPRTGEEPAAPPWMSALESYTAAKAARLGLLLSAANPKNLLLVVSAMAGVAVAGLPAGQAAGVLAVFVAVSSVGVVIPLAYSLLGGEGVRDSLAGWRTWMVANNAVVVAAVLLVLGVLIVFDSLAVLVG